MRLSHAIPVLAALALAVGGWMMVRDDPSQAAGVGVDVTVPTLTRVAAEGRVIFAENCASCHGQDGAGTNQGPPLIHVIYEPNHHGDASFHLAVKQGVRAHHWRFGNMPAVPGVSPDDTTKIIAFVREVQRANGIQ